MEDRGHDPVRNLLHGLRGGMLDWGGRLVDDVTCRKCGYNLRGLALAGRCPECAALVAISAQGDDLLSYPPRWLLRMSHAAQASGWGLFMVFGSLVASLITGSEYVAAFAAFVTVCWCGLACAVSSPPPAEPVLSSTRWAIRVSAALTTVAIAGMYYASHQRAGGMVLGAAVVAVLAFSVTLLAEMRLLAEFVRRMGFEASAGGIQRRPWYLLIAGAAALGLARVCCAGVIAACAAVVLMLVLPITHFQVANLLHAAAHIAQDNWLTAERLTKSPLRRPSI